jgi:hypothetical protein
MLNVIKMSVVMLNNIMMHQHNAECNCVEYQNVWSQFQSAIILSIIKLKVECHYAEYHDVKSHYADYCYGECCYAECHYAVCHYAECHYAECHYACYYAECHDVESHYAECCYAEVVMSNAIKLLT